MVLQDTNIILYLSKGGNNLFKAAEEIRKNKQYIERLTTNKTIELWNNKFYQNCRNLKN